MQGQRNGSRQHGWSWYFWEYHFTIPFLCKRWGRNSTWCNTELPARCLRVIFPNLMACALRSGMLWMAEVAEENRNTEFTIILLLPLGDSGPNLTSSLSSAVDGVRILSSTTYSYPRTSKYHWQQFPDAAKLTLWSIFVFFVMKFCESIEEWWSESSQVFEN